jgi:hypothetical protein
MDLVNIPSNSIETLRTALISVLHAYDLEIREEVRVIPHIALFSRSVSQPISIEVEIDRRSIVHHPNYIDLTEDPSVYLFMSVSTMGCDAIDHFVLRWDSCRVSEIMLKLTDILSIANTLNILAGGKISGQSGRDWISLCRLSNDAIIPSDGGPESW